MADKLIWTNEVRKLGELKPWSRNPRKISKDQARRLKESFQDFGQVETIAISQSGDIYNGHQRLSVLLEKFGPEYEVECRVSSRDLTEREREKLTVFLHKGAAGDWDYDILRDEFDVSDLLEWGFEKDDLSFLDTDPDEVKNPYTTAVKVPQYEIKGECPPLSECYSEEKSSDLIREIQDSNVTEEEKEFLIKAAYRHNVFSYRKIAEYYANASPEMQELMEKSALVIIDFEDAIANGYARLNASFSQMIEDEG